MSITRQNLFLIGPMGAGKTTIGRLLAQALDMDFFDSDREIEARTGVDIPLIFEKEGESGFRLREKAMIAELSARCGIVLATGGGAILDPDNRRLLAERGLVIYLETSVDEQLRRTAHDENRPLLRTPDPRARLEALLQIRAPLYQEIADITVHTDGQVGRRVAAAITARLPCV